MFSLNESIIRSSRPELLCDKGVLKNVGKFTGNPARAGVILLKKML